MSAGQLDDLERPGSASRDASRRLAESAMAFRDKGQPELAARDCQRLIKLDTPAIEDIDACLGVAQSLNLPTLSVDLASKAVELSPQSPDRRAALVSYLMSAQRPDIALREATLALETFKDEPRLCMLCGIILNGQSRFMEAIQILMTSLRGDPINAEAYNQLAFASDHLGLVQPSAQLALRAMQLDRDNPHRALTAAHLVSKAGRADEALEILRKAAQVAAPNPALHRVLSGLLFEDGDHYAALEEIEAAIRLDPRQADYHIHRSNILYRIGRFDEAAGAIDNALAIDPDNASLRRHKVSVLLEGGDVSSAIATTAYLLQLSPGEEEYASCMTHVLAQRNAGLSGLSDIAELKRAAPPRQLRAPGSLADACRTQARVVSALLLREIRTRFGESRLGYFWALLEIAIHLGVLAVVFQFTMHGRPPIGDSFFFFYFTGVFPYLLFVHTSQHVGDAILQNRPLLQLPMVTNLDAMLSRALLELATEVLVGLVFLALFVAFGVDAIPKQLGTLGLAVACVWLMGFGVGMINAVLNVYSHAPRQVYGVLVRFLYFCSGIFYVPSMMPVWLRDILVWNPLMQCVDLTRVAFFETYRPEWLSPGIPVGTALVAITAGLAVEAATRRRLRRLT